jgi:uncharacterized protein YdaU (DUF1376 family)
MTAWHKENKHTVLLSKNVNISKKDDGKIVEYVDEGVPAFGFTLSLQSGIIKYYGFWENYDIGIERTGLQSPAFRVINATKNIEQVSKDLQPFVSSSPLTNEEKSWERYDLDKLFQVTSYTKLWNNLKLSIAKIDSELGTHYLDELKTLMEKEVEERKARNAETDTFDTEAMEAEIAEEKKATTEEVVTRAKPVVNKTPLPFFDKLSKKEQESVVDVEMMNEEEKKALTLKTPAEKLKPGMFWKITYTPGIKRWGACPDCGAKSPEFFAACPVCGTTFVNY